MSTNSKIEWTEAAWLTGCRRRLTDEGMLRARKRGIFTLSVDTQPAEWLDAKFAVMALTPQHTYHVLTKRPERMAEHLDGLTTPDGPDHDRWDAARRPLYSAAKGKERERIGVMGAYPTWPLPNVWLGTSVENQKTADERIPHLHNCPAAVRFLSMEPLLGDVYLCLEGEECEICGNRPDAYGLLEHGRGCYKVDSDGGGFDSVNPPNDIHWIIVGGESGPGARPMHPDWARSIRDQCAAAGVPFFFKQWGEWIGGTYDTRKGKFVSEKPHDVIFWTNPGHRPLHTFEPAGFPWRLHASARVGKQAAGRLLDGVEHNAMPADLRVREMPGVQA